MPNIFKRPMFRKGGSSSYGTGITSGLEPRQRFSNGPPEEGVQSIPRTSNMNPIAYEELIKRQYEQMLPSNKQAIRNFVTGFGASGANDPLQLQTWGSALNKAGATAAGLNREQIAKAEDFRTRAGIEAVKNLTAPEKDQIFRYAKERARILQIPENMRSPNDKEKLIFLDNELKKTQQYLREASPEAKIEDLARKIEKEEGRNLKVGSAKNMAATKFKVEKGEIKDPRTNQPLTNYASRSLRPNEIIFQGDGSIGIVNSDKIIQQTLKTILSPNTIYITQQEGYLYLYEGNNKFRRIYP
jgi:hypothetical protein